VGTQHGLGVIALDRPTLGREPFGDPRRFGPAFVLGDVPVVPVAFHEDDRDEAAAGHDSDEEQPPLELGHLGGPPSAEHRAAV